MVAMWIFFVGFFFLYQLCLHSHEQNVVTLEDTMEEFLTKTQLKVACAALALFSHSQPVDLCYGSHPVLSEPLYDRYISPQRQLSPQHKVEGQCSRGRVDVANVLLMCR